MTPRPQEDGLQSHPCLLSMKGGAMRAPQLNLLSCFWNITSHRVFAETVTQSRIRDTRATQCLGPGCTTLELSLAQLGVSLPPLNGLLIREYPQTRLPGARRNRKNANRSLWFWLKHLRSRSRPFGGSTRTTVRKGKQTPLLTITGLTVPPSSKHTSTS